ncbi:MAG TPA: hypothetical protein VGE07_13200 [Herpetosiphonaceae bacterium]
MARWLRIALAAMMVGGMLAWGRLGGAAEARMDLIEQLWARYDLPVANGEASRSWTWGPKGVYRREWTSVSEEFRDSPGGNRQVVYFDKARMEITDPAADARSPWFISTGLLPIELITGRLQVGFDDFRQRAPAAISAIGDAGGYPTYADLNAVFESPGPAARGELGKPATRLLNADGSISQLAADAGDPATVLEQGANGHLVPRAFVAFQTQRGPLVEFRQQPGTPTPPQTPTATAIPAPYAPPQATAAPVTPTPERVRTEGQLYDPLFTFGLPVTAPYWVKARIGGVEQPVLFQVFERRVLTYNPANPPAFKVEMGNIGRHYYQWRYAAEPFSPPFFDWNQAAVQSYADPAARYTLELEWREFPANAPAGTVPPDREATYRLYFSPDNGQTRELRSSGVTGRCKIVAVALVAPRQQPATADEIGLATQCADNPSAARGAGVTIKQSTDGGRTFWTAMGF